MSVPSGQIRCRGCDFVGVLQYRPVSLRYALSDGSFAEGHRDFGWCNDCGGIRDIEQPLDVRSIQTHVESLKAQRPRGLVAVIDRALGGGSADKAELQRLGRLLQLARMRRSPARCLSCGGVQVKPITFDGDGNCVGFAHQCGGHLYTLPPDPHAPRFHYRPEVVVLDVEGHRLDR